jgi:hypothetical protein
MELLKQESILNGFLRLDLRAGKYKGLLLCVRGVNGTAATADLTNLGNIKLTHQNYGERVNTTFQFLSERTNLVGGEADAVSAAGGAFVFAAILSFRRKFDNQNILVVDANVKTTLSWDGFKATAPAGIVSGTIEVYALYDNTGMQRYIPKIITAQSSVPSAMTLKESIPYPFVEELYGEDDVAIGNIQILRDGQVTHDGAWSALKSLSNALNQVEVAIDTVEMVAPSGGSPSNVRQTTFQLISTGALTGSVFTYHYMVCDPIQ